MKLKNTLVLTVLLGINSQANVLQTQEENSMFFSKDTKISINLDDESKIHPDLYIPIYWTNILSTVVEYRTTQDKDVSKVKGNYDSSHKETTIDKETLNLHLLKYSFVNSSSRYSLGVGYSYEAFDKNQNGYIQSGTDRLDFNNNINIEIQGISISAETVNYDIILDGLSSKFNILVLAASTLDVTQNTLVTGYPNAKGNSTQDLDVIYDVRGDLNYDLFSFMDVGMEARYKFLPMNYTLQLAKLDGTFERKDYDVEEQTIYTAFKLYFKMDLFGSMRPLIGYTNEMTDGKNKLDNTKYSNTENMFIFGIDSTF